MAAEEWRALFDAEVSFANGGGLRTEGFRLDIPGPEITDEELAGLLVRHLGLLMVAEVRISGKTIVAEPHKGGRGTGRPRATEPAGETGAGHVRGRGGAPPRRLLELSHVITNGMTTLPGWPAPRISDWLTREASRANYAPGTEFHVARIDMIANTGTYLDTPAHRWAEGADLAATSVDRLADLAGLVVRVPPGTRAVDRLMLAPYDVAGRAVLLHTGWDAHFGTERYAGHEAPYLTGDGARWLVEEGAALVGIDSINIDDMSPAAAGERPAHSTLLAAGIPIVEHLTGLDALPPDGVRFTAAPPMVAGMGTFPVRAFAVVD
ncbi:Kynurenine formamidase [Micromonospora rhizosphaerae]|uniref:Kynurenine formamidase n=1 Tax=Micromonospora rhizosphaerae TaxID=568872 RepID=A0A1C6RQ97_9ACTN|nr:cyclase family protein [Micromonospora rhizosphaerae]SCL19205.1 Kynurenine formamidase [Micromonospora rhizosphaerae]